MSNNLDVSDAPLKNVSLKPGFSHELFTLSKSSTVEQWKQEILATLARQDDKQCSLLALMRQAKLQSRSVKHPFNDALTALLEEKSATWSNVPGQPIRICLIG